MSVILFVLVVSVCIFLTSFSVSLIVGLIRGRARRFSLGQSKARLLNEQERLSRRGSEEV